MVQNRDAQRPPDVAVVGNGVLGLTVALMLLDRDSDLRVTVLGSPARHHGATSAAGAMLGCYGEVTAASMASEYGRSKLELASRAQSRWPEWLDRLAELAGTSARVRTADDAVVLLNTVGYTALDDRNFVAILNAAKGAGAAHEEIDVHTVDWIDPDSNSRPLRALYLSGEGAVDSRVLLRNLEAAFTRAGGVLCRQDTTAVTAESGRITGVVLDDGDTLLAGQVIVAAGAQSTDLLASLPELAYRIPRVSAGVGVSALLAGSDVPAPTTVLRTPNRAFACGLHLVPRVDGDIYIGATNAVCLEPRAEPSIEEVVFLFNCAAHQLHRGLYNSSVRSIQVGSRPASIDGFPLVGGTSVAGLWLLTGTYRDGLHMSPLLGEHLSSLVLGGDGLPGLEKFQPERELISAWSREEILQEVVAHTMATGYERPWALPLEWPHLIEALLRRPFAELADRLSEVYIPPPDFLTTIMFSGREVQQEIADYYANVYRAWH